MSLPFKRVRANVDFRCAWHDPLTRTGRGPLYLERRTPPLPWRPRRSARTVRALPGRSRMARSFRRTRRDRLLAGPARWADTRAPACPRQARLRRSDARRHEPQARHADGDGVDARGRVRRAAARQRARPVPRVGRAVSRRRLGRLRGGRIPRVCFVLDRDRHEPGHDPSMRSAALPGRRCAGHGPGVPDRGDPGGSHLRGQRLPGVRHDHRVGIHSGRRHQRRRALEDALRAPGGIRVDRCVRGAWWWGRDPGRSRTLHRCRRNRSAHAGGPHNGALRADEAAPPDRGARLRHSRGCDPRAPARTLHTGGSALHRSRELRGPGPRPRRHASRRRCVHVYDPADGSRGRTGGRRYRRPHRGVGPVAFRYAGPGGVVDLRLGHGCHLAHYALDRGHPRGRRPGQGGRRGRGHRRLPSFEHSGRHRVHVSVPFSSVHPRDPRGQHDRGRRRHAARVPLGGRPAQRPLVGAARRHRARDHDRVGAHRRGAHADMKDLEGRVAELTG